MTKRSGKSITLCVTCALTWFGLFAMAKADSVFLYEFPASWDGVAATATDLSAAGNDANVGATPALSANVPAGAPLGSQSVDTSGGQFRTQNTLLLNNADIAAAGGFRFDTTFLWNGTAGGFSVQKIIDYAGTDFLQLESIDTGAGTAMLRFGFNDDALIGTTLFAPIDANQWYEVSGIFDTQGNSVAGDGSLSGLATLIVNGQSFSESITKTTAGDNLNRAIGIGGFAAGGGALIELEGNIFRASLTLIPEPSTALLLIVSAIAGLCLRRNL